jgi:hypothetical protein
MGVFGKDILIENTLGGKIWLNQIWFGYDFG